MGEKRGETGWVPKKVKGQKEIEEERKKV